MCTDLSAELTGYPESVYLLGVQLPDVGVPLYTRRRRDFNQGVCIKLKIYS